MRTVEELEALLETVTRERDLSLSAWESAGMQGRTAQSAMLELARQLEQACEMVELQNARLGQHHGAEIRMERERDEARAEVERLRELLDENAYERGLLARRMTEAQARRDEAYRRGAEAMREACIAWARAPENDWEHLAHELENMPIPEEP